MIIVVLIVVALFVWAFLLRPRKINLNETIIAFTGGLGSNKSVMSVKTFLKLCKRANLSWRIDCFKKWLKHKLTPKSKRSALIYDKRPMFLSNIPINSRSKNIAVIRLTPSVLLLQTKLTPRSVVLIDEVDTFCNQFEFSIPNIKKNFDEFMRLFRHYTKNGHLVLNTQCSSNMVLQIRRRCNVVYNLYFNKKLFGFFRTNCRVITISDEIQAVETKDKDEDSYYIYGCYWGLKKVFDTHCYSERVKPLLIYSNEKWLDNINGLKTNVLLSCPSERFDYTKYLNTND